MKNKKIKKDFSIAITHFLTSGIFFPLAFVLILLIVFDFFLKVDIYPLTLNIYLIFLAFTILGFWLGNIVAIRYINKKYEVKNKKNILNFSLLYLIIFSFIFFDTDINFSFSLLILFSFIEIIIYYFISKLYIAKIKIYPNNIDENKTTNNEKQSKKRIVFKLLKIFVITIITFIVLFFSVPFLLHTFKGSDIEPPSDDDLILNKRVDILEDENSYFDLLKLSSVYDYEAELYAEIEIKLLDELNTMDFLNSYNWEEYLVEKLLEKNKEALDIYTLASTRPFFQYDKTANPINISSNLPIIGMNSWREITRINLIKAIHLFKQGEEELAFNQAMKSVIVGQTIKESKNLPLITYLVGLTIKMNGLETLEFLINNNSLSPEILRSYQEDLTNYHSKYNHDFFKVEYILEKENLDNILSSNYYIDEDRVLIENNFYFKPNKTLELFADYYREINTRINTDCKVSFPEIEIWTPSSRFEMYFTENSYGKSLLNDTLSSVRERKCEVEFLLDKVIKSLY